MTTTSLHPHHLNFRLPAWAIAQPPNAWEYVQASVARLRSMRRRARTQHALMMLSPYALRDLGWNRFDLDYM